MIDLKSMDLAEMTGLLKGWGEPAFRARQVFRCSTGVPGPLTR